jgi:uncharacterized membrane protein
MTTKKKWEWNLKNGALFVATIVAGVFLGCIVTQQPTVSVILNCFIAAIGSSFLALLSWRLAKKK